MRRRRSTDKARGIAENHLAPQHTASSTDLGVALERINLKASATKGNKRRYLPIYGDMREYLERCEAETQQVCPATPFLFHYKGGTPILSFGKAWRRACREAGVPNLKFHDLRRTALTHMEEAGIPRSVATAISGHLTESVYKRYVISRSKALKDAGEVLEAYLKGEHGHSDRAQ